ncbi:NAD(P)H-dependent glycerol-3-phosphate dehydrogenase [Streptococcus dysgalactiae subsp. equisimilis]|uniref:NAD(P)H-dependent glycerol-3-phosphate dehydrogenase n=1 Tax=Streptococcus dysgalactiae TaxID=1334 RepID=UPI000A10811A|nr:NAD(P)H-dependent glycerol-3-phosphate dehydrogenase [Streptococcus dysgalactiae]MCY7196044.1 NAD(P)H-dependent glycerol-3-phosphate dehydrogenase [Streptococcus dysgalactiae]MCY7199910.1 NAD(P)H-dependent glycerol-3-phosphate dehydrogenase [Streptococcus dysgalactiae]MCY7205997.1 NAD(P)H-dependent glycerol-3-phosphate dehydrogenase [Streptococcus dysgalactiae]MCY7215453.1 NAD(P)H-dependent glycerol-3-phosphate dehydrogenase [Streptococcus dysgalactiae]ORJ90605.1 glycerol-3-phosphate dehydr
MTKQKVAILGPGSWGTALSQVLNDNGHDVRLWGNIPAQIDEINTEHTNKHYFKDIVLDEKIKATLDLREALADVDAVLFVVPTKVTRLVAKQVAEVLDHKVVVMHASKGLEPGTHERLSTILEEEIPADLRSEVVVVSGPSHAEETIVRDITLITAASKDIEAAKYVQSLFSNHYFRLYTNTDVVGVETAGALKNIIAVGAGALHGLGYGDNAKAAVITRGLAEITRLGVKLGADPLTYSGLSGVGDLIVTGTSVHSRNWRAGDALGRGEKLEDIERNMGMVIEGISTTKVAYEIAQELGVYMPITSAIYKSIYEGADIKESILGMMSNEVRSENEWH